MLEMQKPIVQVVTGFENERGADIEPSLVGFEEQEQTYLPKLDILTRKEAQPWRGGLPI